MDVEQEYRNRVRAMSVAEKVRRAEELFEWVRSALMRDIVARRGPMSAGRLKRELALRLYGSDPAMRRLIEGLADRALD